MKEGEIEDSWRRPALAAQGNTGLLGMFHDWGRRNPGMMGALLQQPFTGPLLTVADMLDSQPSFVQQMQARDEAWREARSNGASIGELLTAPVETDDPLLSLALGTVVPFGRAGQAPHLVRARNLGFTEPGYVAGRSYSDDLAEAMADIPYDRFYRGHVVASNPEAALRFAGINPGDPGVGAQVMRVLARPGEMRPVRAPHGISDAELRDRVFDAWARGPDSVRVIPGHGTGSLLIVPDQRFIRAAHARFDPHAALEPRHIDSRNLLAGIGAGGAMLPLLNLGLSGE